MKRAPLLLAVLALSACSTLQKIVEPPKVELREIGFQNPSLTDATLLLKLDVVNPNSFELRLDEVTYNLSLENKPLTRGELAQGLKLAADQTTPVELPVRMKYSEVYDSVFQMLKKGKSPYQFKGTLRSGLLEIPFDKKGEVKLPRP